jgi:hypothetical protein
LPGGGICYANSNLFSELELCIYEDWNYATFMQRREKIATWMKERWHVEDYTYGQNNEEFDDDYEEEEFEESER